MAANAIPGSERELITTTHAQLALGTLSGWKRACAQVLGDGLVSGVSGLPRDLQGPAYALLVHYAKTLPPADPYAALFGAVLSEVRGNALFSASRLLPLSRLAAERRQVNVEPPDRAVLGGLGTRSTDSAQSVDLARYDLGLAADGTGPWVIVSAHFVREDRGTVLGQRFDATNHETVYLLLRSDRIKAPELSEAMEAISSNKRESGASVGIVPRLIRNQVVEAGLVVVKTRRSANYGDPLQSFFFIGEESVAGEGPLGSLRTALAWTTLVNSIVPSWEGLPKAPVAAIAAGATLPPTPAAESLSAGEKWGRFAGRWLGVSSAFGARRGQLEQSPTRSLVEWYANAPEISDRVLAAKATQKLPVSDRTPARLALLKKGPVELQVAVLDEFLADPDFVWTDSMERPVGLLFGSRNKEVRTRVHQLTVGRSDAHSLAAIRIGMYDVRLGTNFDGSAGEIVAQKYATIEALKGRSDEAHIEFIDGLLQVGISGPNGEYCQDWFATLLGILAEARRVSPEMDQKITTLVRMRLADDSWDYIASNLLGGGGRRYTVEREGLRASLLGPLP